ncbi:MAG TPA: hydrogenobyrinic acid a,c-diamide synthase (glutamine-hydrolyzing) [Nitrospirae bacterium]|nr:hydrogenobyrinic acid a,c-diamide synthase (glutamine-hydrolyzing) [Nitrospirota bacterium]
MINEEESPCTAARVVIAGLRGGSGKTTLSLGLIKVLRDSGLRIRAFKKGPDYIDAGWLAAASGCDCYNLDPYLFSDQKILQSFSLHSRDADCALVEGNRGLYDGMHVEGTYSTAELAKLLKAPVVLVVDCTKVTRTLAAVIRGVVSFDPDVDVRGVILNNIAGSRHESVIRGAIEKYTPVEVYGAMPRLKDERFPERHMGLTPHHEHPEVSRSIELMGRLVRDAVDCEKVLETARSAPELRSKGYEAGAESASASCNHSASTPGVRIGIIKDMAFQFYYPDNFEALRNAGAELVEISAITEGSLPDVDALYIGGGFPETNAILLSENRDFMRSLRRAVEDGLPVYAECGGLMYLGREIEFAGKTYPMTDILPISFRMEDAPVAHGYTMVEVVEENPYFRKSVTLKGHEFHYSRVVDHAPDLRMVFAMKRGRGIDGRADGIVHRNVLATYTHLHALGSPEWVSGMMRAAGERARNQRRLSA